MQPGQRKGTLFGSRERYLWCIDSDKCLYSDTYLTLSFVTGSTQEHDALQMVMEAIARIRSTHGKHAIARIRSTHGKHGIKGLTVILTSISRRLEIPWRAVFQYREVVSSVDASIMWKVLGIDLSGQSQDHVLAVTPQLSRMIGAILIELRYVWGIHLDFVSHH